MGENQLYYGDNLDVLRRHVADESVDLEEIHDERRRMGPGSLAGWKVVAIMSAMLTLWIASTWLPVFDTFLVAVVGRRGDVPGARPKFQTSRCQDAT